MAGVVGDPTGRGARWQAAIQCCRANRDAARRPWHLVLPGCERGRIAWGHPIKANAAIFHEGQRSQTLGGVCVYADDDAGEVDGLAQVAEYVSDLRRRRTDDPELLAVQRVIGDDYINFKPMLLPAQITRGRTMHMAILWMARARLPIGRLIKAPLPVIAPLRARSHAVVLPLELWAREIADAWREAAADPTLAQDPVDFVPLTLPPA